MVEQSPVAPKSGEIVSRPAKGTDIVMKAHDLGDGRKYFCDPCTDKNEEIARLRSQLEESKEAAKFFQESGEACAVKLINTEATLAKTTKMLIDCEKKWGCECPYCDRNFGDEFESHEDGCELNVLLESLEKGKERDDAGHKDQG